MFPLARQCGIDNACGEYTIHADPDDWADPTMIEVMYRKAKETDADMVIADYYVNTIDGKRMRFKNLRRSIMSRYYMIYLSDYMVIVGIN